jgi:hypothetical protein
MIFAVPKIHNNHPLLVVAVKYIEWMVLMSRLAIEMGKELKSHFDVDIDRLKSSSRAS